MVKILVILGSRRWNLPNFPRPVSLCNSAPQTCNPEANTFSAFEKIPLYMSANHELNTCSSF